MRRSEPLLLLALCISIGCAKSGPPKPPPLSEEARAALEADLASYRQSVEAGDFASAVATGEQILQAYPGSTAAEEVAGALPGVRIMAKAAEEDRRVADLWAYQTGTESGGAQSAASIFASEPATGAERMRLILRRHAEWGESAYLYAGGAGFACPKPCTVSLQFDGGPAEKWPASLPATGEPAIFIDEHERLAQRIAAAERLEIEVALVDRGPSKSAFEVGGFDPAKWQPL